MSVERPARLADSLRRIAQSFQREDMTTSAGHMRLAADAIDHYRHALTVISRGKLPAKELLAFVNKALEGPPHA